MLRRLGRDPSWILFYAWCPLPVKEYANTGHFDPLATFFTVLAVLLPVAAPSDGDAVFFNVSKGKVQPEGAQELDEQ